MWVHVCAYTSTQDCLGRGGCVHTQVCLHIRDAYKHVWQSVVGVHICLPGVGEALSQAWLGQARVVSSGAKSHHYSWLLPPQCPIQPSGGRDAHEAGPWLSDTRGRLSTEVLYQGLGKRKGKPCDQGWGHWGPCPGLGSPPSPSAPSCFLSLPSQVSTFGYSLMNILPLGLRVSFPGNATGDGFRKVLSLCSVSFVTSFHISFLYFSCSW